MQTTDNKSSTVSVLNDLVLINNDRVAGYEKALEELRSRKTDTGSDADLESLFASYITDSREFSAELSREVNMLGEEAEEGTMASGKLYRAWMDVKALFSGKDRHTILSSCETGEDAAQKAYKDALATEGISENVRAIILKQQTELKRAHDKIKMLRDASA